VKKSTILRQWLPAAFIVLSAAIFSCAQEASSTKQNARPGQETAPVASSSASAPETATKYSYEFNQPKFYVKHILFEHDGEGHGTITFERLNEDVPVTESVEVSRAALARIKSAWTALNFLDSQSDYQANKDFSHLGVMKIGMQQGERKRIAEFNWTHDDHAAALVAEYHRVTDQAILVFDISIARENLPLNAPKLMEVMESMIKRNALSDPNQLLPLLRDMSTDEHIPLMARNHALRIIKQIQK
jgi:hypothetical protein